MPAGLKRMASATMVKKNCICIDLDHGFIHRYAITSANVHNNQMPQRLLDPENQHDFVWADSAYSGECFEELLSLGGFQSLIHEKGARNHPLRDADKELNRIKSAIRALACLWRHDRVDGWKAHEKDWA
jgi:IS5 family transposase